MRSRNTLPERVLQSQLTRRGIDFKCHVRQLPGTPDLVIPAAKVAVFVNGCYWHSHFSCLKSRDAYSYSIERLALFGKVVKGDYWNSFKLSELGWTSVTLWECELKSRPSACAERVVSALREVNAC